MTRIGYRMNGTGLPGRGAGRARRRLLELRPFRCDERRADDDRAALGSRPWRAHRRAGGDGEQHRPVDQRRRDGPAHRNPGDVLVVAARRRCTTPSGAATSPTALSRGASRADRRRRVRDRSQLRDGRPAGVRPDVVTAAAPVHSPKGEVNVPIACGGVVVFPRRHHRRRRGRDRRRPSAERRSDPRRGRRHQGQGRGRPGDARTWRGHQPRRYPWAVRTDGFDVDRGRRCARTAGSARRLQVLRRGRGAQRRELRGPRRDGARPDRRQRSRQVDADQVHLRECCGRTPARSSSTVTRSSLANPEAARPPASRPCTRSCSSSHRSTSPPTCSSAVS